MDILFCNMFNMKQGVFILAIQHLNNQGTVATWNNVANLMGVTSPTVRKVGQSLAQEGIITITPKEDEFGGSLPTELTLNSATLNQHLKQGGYKYV